MRDQVGRMQAVIDYQLRRAAATGPRTLAPTPVVLAPIAREIAASLRKIHRDRPIDCRLEIPEHARYPAEAGDLYELIGNLLDNAWKWAAGRVAVRMTQAPPGSECDAPALSIEVADDGPGIPAELAEQVLARGVRGDERGEVPGQGIGLAVVNELVGLYGGSLTIGRSGLGGALVRITLPRTN
jgi:two-component system sensor histidine kinase PhoQ